MGHGNSSLSSLACHNCCCIRFDLASDTFLLFLFFFGLFHNFIPVAPHLSSILSLIFQLILCLFSLLIYPCTSFLSLPSFPFSPSPRRNIITRLSRGPWTFQSSGGSFKRRTQLIIPPQRRWYQTCASCSGTVLSSIMYVFSVFPLFYFPVTQSL